MKITLKMGIATYDEIAAAQLAVRFRTISKVLVRGIVHAGLVGDDSMHIQQRRRVDRLVADQIAGQIEDAPAAERIGQVKTFESGSAPSAPQPRNARTDSEPQQTQTRGIAGLHLRPPSAGAAQDVGFETALGLVDRLVEPLCRTRLLRHTPQRGLIGFNRARSAPCRRCINERAIVVQPGWMTVSRSLCERRRSVSIAAADSRLIQQHQHSAGRRSHELSE